MRITSVRETKRGRFAVDVDGEFWCALHPDALWQGGLKEGMETDPKFLEEIRMASETRFAVEKAARILSHAANTSHQLYEKLCRTVDPQAAAAAVERMLQLGYLDDEADGIFGRRTEAAVRAARQAAGMDDSGVADDNFQHALYAEDFPAAAQQ